MHVSNQHTVSGQRNVICMVFRWRADGGPLLDGYNVTGYLKDMNVLSTSLQSGSSSLHVKQFT